MVISIILNSKKSTYKISEEVEKERTLSPWIYEEIFFTSVIGVREWYEHRKKVITEGENPFEELFKVSYLLSDEHFISIGYEDLCEWNKRWHDRDKKRSGSLLAGLVRLENKEIPHPLDVLYEYKCGYDEK